MTNNQFHFLFSYLKKEKINIDFDEFKIQAETHPDFPSLYAFSDTLSFFKIDNFATKVNKELLDQLPDNFVALLESENKIAYLSFVEKTNTGYTYTKGNTKHSVNKSKFLDLWKNVVLVVDKAEETLTTKTKSNLLLWVSGILLFNLLIISLSSLIHVNWLTIVSLILGLAGVYLSIEALKQVFGVSSSFTEAVCNTKSNQVSNCQSVITSKKSGLFLNIELSDLSIVFFSGHLLSLFVMSIAGMTQQFILASLAILILATPVLLYSIYYQWLVEKKWCTICLMIIGVLVLEAGVFAFNNSLTIVDLNLNSINLFLLGFVASFFIWIILKPIIKNYVDNKSTLLKLLRFKRNYNLFKLALLDSKAYDYTTLESKIQVGKPNAKIKISIITNPYCGHCIKAHKQIENILSRYENDILINFRFNLDLENYDEVSKLLHFRLLDIYNEKGEKEFMNALGYWFENKDSKNWFKLYGKGNFDQETEQFFSRQYKQNSENKFLYTPTIIIGDYLYPENYSREDLIYFISELIDDNNLFLKSEIKPVQEIFIS